MYLPPEIYDYISEHLPPSAQPAFRRANKATSAARFDWTKHFCKEPTIPEIADWLWDQHLRLIDPATGYQTQCMFYIDGLTSFYFTNEKDSQLYSDIVSFDLNTRNISDLKYVPGFFYNYSKTLVIKSKDDLKQTLSGKHLTNDPNSILCLRMWHGILLKRTSCINHGMIPDQCYLTYLAKHLSQLDWTKSLRDLHFLIKEPAMQRLFDDLTRDFDILFDFDFSELGASDWYHDDPEDGGGVYAIDMIRTEMSTIPPDVYQSWIKQWILNLSSEDLF